jgi:dTDP-4-dehydrorhamnose reductase
LKEVIPINTSEYPTLAKRPINSIMDCSLLEQEFNICPSRWEESLANMLNSYFHGSD